MNIALVDMDGTLCDYEGALRDKLRDLVGRDANIHDKHYKKLVDLIKKQPGFWSGLQPIPAGFKMVCMLQDAGFEVHILTKGPYRTTSAWTEKVEWCREHLPGVPVTITEDKGLMYGRILFDDWPPYCESWLKFRPRGLVIMPAYEYNKGFEEKYPGQVIRLTGDNWNEIEEVIKKAAKRLPGESMRG